MRDIEPVVFKQQAPSFRARIKACVNTCLKVPFAKCFLPDLKPAADSNSATSPSSFADLESHAATVRKVDVVLSLLNVKGFFTSKSHQLNAIRETRAYINANSKEGSLLEDILRGIVDDLPNYKGNITLLKADHEHPQRADRATIRRMVASLIKNVPTLALTDHQVDDLLEESRLDKRATGLANTLIASPENAKLYSLHSTINPNSRSTPPLISTLYQQLLDTGQQHKTHTGKSTCLTPAVTITHGEGSFGKVKTAIDIGANKVKAVKKFDQAYRNRTHISVLCKSAEHENAAMKTLKALLTPKEQDSFLLPESLVEALGSKGQTKAYIMSPLMIESDGEEALQKSFAQSLFSSTAPEANNQLQELMTQWISGVEILEKYNLCHPDLKPANTLGGKICDLADLIQYKGKSTLETLYRGNYIHTASYMPPEYQSETTFGYRSAAECKDRFKAFNRFSLGLMLVEAATGNQVAVNPSTGRKNIFDIPVDTYVAPNGQLKNLRLKRGYNHIEKRISALEESRLSPVRKASAVLGFLLASTNPLERIAATEAKRYLPLLTRAYEANSPLTLTFKTRPPVCINS